MTTESADIRHEGQPAFPSEPEKETPASSPEDIKPTETDPSAPGANKEPDKQVPFHEHPRWKQREQEWNQRLEDMQRDYEDKLNQKFAEVKPHEDPTIPNWFGGDKQQWQDFQTYLESMSDQKAAAKVEEYKKAQEAETAKVKAANDYIEGEIDRLKADGKDFDRNELLKVVNDYRPVNEQGYWDFDKAYDILEMKRKANAPVQPDPAIRKQAGAIEKTSTKTDPGKKDYMTNEDFRRGGRPW